jgi:hypothetical protein
VKWRILRIILHSGESSKVIMDGSLVLQLPPRAEI